ncbi:hypothetical protein C8J56DRAFT_1168005 [Mycena floridula]|nr:hypothetical protein C8J56DRAFT_1168005 [Mycena floridula]
MYRRPKSSDSVVVELSMSPLKRVYLNSTLNSSRATSSFHRMGTANSLTHLELNLKMNRHRQAGYRISHLLKDQQNLTHLSLGTYYGSNVPDFVDKLLEYLSTFVSVVIIYVSGGINCAIGATCDWIVWDCGIRVVLSDSTSNHAFSGISGFMIQCRRDRNGQLDCDRGDIDWAAEIGAPWEMAKDLQRKRRALKLGNIPSHRNWSALKLGRAIHWRDLDTGLAISNF